MAVMKRDRFAPSETQFADVIKRISDDLCRAQNDVMFKSAEALAGLAKVTVALPVAYRQVTGSDGKSRLERISELVVPLASFIPPGVFTISSVQVDLPAKVAAGTGRLPQAPATRAASDEPLAPASGMLHLTYQYERLTGIVPSAVIQAGPIVGLAFSGFGADPKYRGMSRAEGLVSVRDERTGRPLAKARVYLGLNEGSVLPSTGKLDKNGEIRFRLMAPTQKGGVLNASMLVLVSGIVRRFTISLEPDESTGRTKSPESESDG